MYQGKFDSQNKKSQRSVYELIEERGARKAAKPAPKAPAGERPAPKAPVTVPGQAAPVSGRSAAPQSPSLPPRKSTGTLTFYTVCMGFVFVFFLATFLGLRYLNGWLVRFESAQPTAKSAEAFQELFASPDWDALYDRAGMTIGKDSFRQVMEEKVGAQALSYAETSVGLAKNQKKNRIYQCNHHITIKKIIHIPITKIQINQKQTNKQNYIKNRKKSLPRLLLSILLIHD